ncbi:MAG: ATP-binding protein, partial [bacterium]
MPVCIEEINVQNLGPITQFSLQPGRFNLIYGHNEKGKTYLVEFVIRSLFRNARLWQLRGQKGRGKVTVTGLKNGESFEFNPASPKKLEDFWDENNVGLPPDFARLLVVKGAEVEIANVAGGADKTILKRFLSSKEILDKIDKNISRTLQESQIEQNTITGPHRGEINTRTELQEQLQKINQLFDQIDKGYSAGPCKALADKLESLQEELDQQMKAKKFLAYQIDQEIRQLKEKKNRIAADKLQEVKSGLTLYKQKFVEYKKKKDDQSQAELKSQHYEWLKSAHEVYQSALSPEVKSPKPVWLLLAIFMVVLAGILAFLQQPIFAAIALAGVVLFGVLYIKKYHNLAKQAAEIKEIENLKKEFKFHFQRELTGLPMVMECLEDMEEDYNTSRLLKKQLTEDYNTLTSLKLKLSEQIKDLTGESKEPKTWIEVLRNLEDRLQSLENQIRAKELYLVELGVDPSDYQSEPAEVEFSKEKLDELEDKHKSTQNQLHEETQKLTNLKQLVCQQTGDDITIGWEVVINNLRKRREKVLMSYKQITAEIIGKIAVHEVIKDLRKAEDDKIISGLKSKRVQEPLFEVTNRYNSLELEGERLVVSDPFNNFYLSDLSTGAQEQVLLALRIGFSTRIVSQDSLFLILDDAFQYSDWQRRKLLVDKVADLAQKGWQIIYFTMDDNIRKLFDEKRKIFQ